MVDDPNPLDPMQRNIAAGKWLREYLDAHYSIAENRATRLVMRAFGIVCQTLGDVEAKEIARAAQCLDAAAGAAPQEFRETFLVKNRSTQAQGLALLRRLRIVMERISHESQR